MISTEVNTEQPVINQRWGRISTSTTFYCSDSSAAHYVWNRAVLQTTENPLNMYSVIWQKPFYLYIYTNCFNGLSFIVFTIACLCLEFDYVFLHFINTFTEIIAKHVNIKPAILLSYQHLYVY